MVNGNPPADRDLERVRRVKERVAPRYLRWNSVTGVGVGIEEVGGVATGRVALRVYVHRKGHFPPDERLPVEVEGVPVDVVEARFGPLGAAAPPAAEAAAPSACPVPHQEDLERYAPLVGGISAGSKRLGPFDRPIGTAGLVVTSRRGGEPLLLSNYHVFAERDEECGAPIYQPSMVDGVGSPRARLAGWRVGNVPRCGRQYGVDAAVARIDPGNAATLRYVEEIGTVAGAGEAKLGTPVLKRGRTTRLTGGRVAGLHADIKIDYGSRHGTIILGNQIEAVSTSGYSFAASGDSGSVVVDSGTRQVLGLLCGVSDCGRHGLANPIGVVLEELDVSI